MGTIEVLCSIETPARRPEVWPLYSTWSLYARGDGSFTMYVNSYRDSDYYFALTGASGGFY